MATIDDFGGTADPLSTPPLGGPTGWAAAVRDFITGLPADIAGKVSKSGDTMTGALTVIGPVGDSPRIFMTEDTRTAQLTAAGNPINLSARNADNTDYVPIRCAEPTVAVHAATKQYADSVFPDGGNAFNGDLNTLKAAGFHFGYTYTNGPVGSGNIMTFIVVPYSPDWGSQIAIQPLAAGPKVWARSWSGTGGATWSTWKVWLA